MKARLLSLTGAAGLVLTLAGVVLASAEGGGHGTEGQMTNLFWRVLNFIVIVGALVYFVRKPIKQLLGGRTEGIKNELEDLERRKAEAEKALAEAETRLEAIEAQQQEIISGYIRAGEAEKARIIEAAEKSAERIRALADMTISEEIKKARAGLIDEIADMSTALAAELVRKNINDTDQKRLVGEYLAKVAEG